MHIEIKKNRIILEFDEAESRFLETEASRAQTENVQKYIKEKVSEALALQNLPEAGHANVGRDFNLTKIKKVSAELKKKNYKAADLPLANPLGPKEEIRPEASPKDSSTPGEYLEESNAENASDLLEDLDDELLADLLDKDLLRGNKKDNKEPRT